MYSPGAFENVGAALGHTCPENCIKVYFRLFTLHGSLGSSSPNQQRSHAAWQQIGPCDNDIREDLGQSNLLAEGLNKNQIAKRLHIGRGSVYRALEKRA